MRPLSDVKGEAMGWYGVRLTWLYERSAGYYSDFIFSILVTS